VDDCCKRVPPNHWNNHNRQVRVNGCCGCSCHRGDTRSQRAPRRIATREQLLGVLQRLDAGVWPSEHDLRSLIDSHLAAIS
jgi:hypothetical protein